MANKYDIASSMDSIISSPSYQAVFARPQPVFTKTAAKKEDDDDKAKAKEKADKEKEKAKKEAEKEKAEKAKAKEKADKEKAKAKADKAKAKAKKMSHYQACVVGLAKISETLDNAGLEKAAALTLLALDSLVANAEENAELVDSCAAKDGKKKDKEEEDKDKEEDEEDEEEEEEEEDEEEGKKKGHKGDKNDVDSGYSDDNYSDFGDALREDDPDFVSLHDELEGDEPQLPEGFEFESLLHGDDGSEEESHDGENFDIESLIGRDPSMAATKMTSLQKLALELQETRRFLALGKKGKEKAHDPKAKVRNKSSAIFGAKHPKVKDDKDHFPIDTIGRGRNALARAGQFSSAPSWWSGSLEELKSAVSRAVHGKYPSIKSEKKDKKSSLTLGDLFTKAEFNAIFRTAQAGGAGGAGGGSAGGAGGAPSYADEEPEEDPGYSTVPSEPVATTYTPPAAPTTAPAAPAQAPKANASYPSVWSSVQSALGVTVDGKLGPKTVAAINAWKSHNPNAMGDDGKMVSTPSLQNNDPFLWKLITQDKESGNSWQQRMQQYPGK